MARKEDKTGDILPSDLGHSFEVEDNILNYKPKIEWEEPEQQFLEQPEPTIEQESELAGLRKRTQDLIDGYKSVVGLIDIAQDKIDNRVKTGGGFDVQLDPKVDANAIAALKRCFPEATDYSKISYEMYKHCLARMNKNATDAIPKVSDNDIQAAKQDPLRTDFGGMGNLPGQNRTEISAPGNPIQPIDIGAFQIAGVLALFKMMYPLIKKEDKKEIAEHLVETPHKPI